MTNPAFAPEAAAVAAGHVLAHAALEAFSTARAGQCPYELFHLDDHEVARSAPARGSFICDKLKQLLDGYAPEVPWDTVEQVILDHVSAVLDRLQAAGQAGEPAAPSLRIAPSGGAAAEVRPPPRP